MYCARQIGTNYCGSYSKYTAYKSTDYGYRVGVVQRPVTPTLTAERIDYRTCEPSPSKYRTIALSLSYSHQGQQLSDHPAELRKHPQVA